MQQASPPVHRKKKLVKKPNGNTLDRCNLRRHKLRKRTIRLGTLNVKFSTNMLIILGGVTYEIYCRWHGKLNGLEQINFSINYLLSI